MHYEMSPYYSIIDYIIGNSFWNAISIFSPISIFYLTVASRDNIIGYVVKQLWKKMSHFQHTRDL